MDGEFVAPSHPQSAVAPHGIAGYVGGHTAPGSRWERRASYALFFLFFACTYVAGPLASAPAPGGGA